MEVFVIILKGILCLGLVSVSLLVLLVALKMLRTPILSGIAASLALLTAAAIIPFTSFPWVAYILMSLLLFGVTVCVFFVSSYDSAESIEENERLARHLYHVVFGIFIVLTMLLVLTLA